MDGVSDIMDCARWMLRQQALPVLPWKRQKKPQINVCRLPRRDRTRSWRRGTRCLGHAHIRGSPIAARRSEEGLPPSTSNSKENHRCLTSMHPSTLPQPPHPYVGLLAHRASAKPSRGRKRRPPPRHGGAQPRGPPRRRGARLSGPGRAAERDPAPCAPQPRTPDQQKHTLPRCCTRIVHMHARSCKPRSCTTQGWH